MRRRERSERTASHIGMTTRIEVTMPLGSPELDPVLLRAQKHGLVELATDSANPDSPWLWGVVNLLDALQDSLVPVLGEQAVFGPDGGDAVGRCRHCGWPVALDGGGGEPVWVDATGGDVCTSETAPEAGDDGEHGHRV